MTLDYNILAPTIVSLVFAALSLLIIFLLPVDWKRVPVRIQRKYINLPNRDKTFLLWYGRAWYVAVMLFLAGWGIR